MATTLRTSAGPALRHRLAGLALVLLLAGCGGSGGAADTTTAAPVGGIGTTAGTPAVAATAGPLSAADGDDSRGATGPVYYVADCQTGAQAGCVAGDNANAGTSPAAPKRSLDGFDVNALPAGARVLFARGGAWSGFHLALQNMNATPDQPLVFGAYNPPWGGTAAPWLRAGGLFFAFQFGDFNDLRDDGGYTIRNLKIDGGGASGQWGFYIRNDARHVTIEHNEITGFELGIHSTETGPLGNVALTIRANHIHHNSDIGVLGSAQQLLMEDNLFEANNFSGSGFSHAAYLGGHGHDGVVRRNRFSANSVVAGVCTGGNFTVHGQWDGLLVEGNVIEQAASDGGCYGISINSAYDTAEWFRRVVIRGNTIVNLGNCAICLTSAPGVVVENNLIINTQATYQAAIVVPDRFPGPGDDLDDGAIVRNNTIVMTRAKDWSEGIGLRANSGANQQIVSNLIVFGAGSQAAHQCFNHQPRANFAAFANNLCFHAGGGGQWSPTYATLAAAQAAGFDAGGQSADPLFIATPDAAARDDGLQSSSPARGAGHPTLSSASDRLGVSRGNAPSVGARQ